MNTFKKTTAVALALGMLITTVPYAVYAEAPTATAAATLTQDQAIQKIKQLITIPEGFKLQQANYQDGDRGGYPTADGNAVWMITFANENRFEQSWINVIIDANTGTLLQYNFNDRNAPSLETSITREEARAKALAHLKKVAPEQAAEVQEMSAYDPKYAFGSRGDLHAFRFVRMVNGLPFVHNSINLSVDGNGVLRDYSINWSKKVEFPKADATVTAEQASQTFRDALNLELQYIRTVKPYQNEISGYDLAYGVWQRGSLPTIDASTGKHIGPNGKELPAAKPLDLKPLTEKPGAPLISGELTKEQGIEMINKFGIDLEGYKLESTSYQTYRNANEHVWRYEFRKGTPEDYKNMKIFSISLDAKTGEMRDMFRHDYMGPAGTFPDNPKVSVEQAKEKAVEFLKKSSPTRTHLIGYDASLSPADLSFKGGNEYGFRFFPLHDGIPSSSEAYMLFVDPNTGAVTQFRSEYPSVSQNVTYADKKQAMPVENATRAFIERYPLKLQYVPVYETTPTYGPLKVIGAKLAYAPLTDSSAMYLNALSGEWISLWGGTPTEPVEAKDIKGHWAEKQLQLLIDRGIFPVKNGKVNPDDAVTRGDMIKYLVQTVNVPRTREDKGTFNDVDKSDDNFEFILEAVSRRWLTKEANFRPKDAITRQELAEIIANILGYTKLSEAPKTFLDHFRDVSADNERYYGDIAIVNSLGILTTNAAGDFFPQQTVSKAQAALVITRVLDQLKDRSYYTY